MAGAEGLEPPVLVLETSGLPVNRRPQIISKDTQIHQTIVTPAFAGMTIERTNFRIELFCFFVGGMLPTGGAKLIELQFFLPTTPPHIMVVAIVALATRQHEHETISSHCLALSSGLKKLR